VSRSGLAARLVGAAGFVPTVGLSWAVGLGPAQTVLGLDEDPGMGKVGDLRQQGQIVPAKGVAGLPLLALRRKEEPSYGDIMAYALVGLISPNDGLDVSESNLMDNSGGHNTQFDADLCEVFPRTSTGPG
jgi:hypothetical protein